MNYLIINEKTKDWHISPMKVLGEDEICIEDFDISNIDLPNSQNYIVNNSLDGLIINQERVSEDNIRVIKAQRDLHISQAEWRRTRHQDEVTLGMEPTEPLLPILEYIQALREVPQQEGFPVNVAWPVPPWEEEVIND